MTEPSFVNHPCVIAAPLCGPWSSTSARTPRYAVSRRAVVSSHAGNGAGTKGTGGTFEADSSPHKWSQAQRVKQQLLQLISAFINDAQQLHNAQLLIAQLEAYFTAPLTYQFTEMAISGSWKLLFSSARTSTRGNVRIRHIGQSIQAQQKLLINQASFTFPDDDGMEQKASMQIVCSYQFVSPSRLKVQLKDHVVKFEAREEAKAQASPRDLRRIITEMQLLLPREFFDPSGLVDVTYVDPSFRIWRFLGKKMAGVRNVFVICS